MRKMFSKKQIEGMIKDGTIKSLNDLIPLLTDGDFENFEYFVAGMNYLNNEIFTDEANVGDILTKSEDAEVRWESIPTPQIPNLTADWDSDNEVLTIHTPSEYFVDYIAFSYDASDSDNHNAQVIITYNTTNGLFEPTCIGEAGAGGIICDHFSFEKGSSQNIISLDFSGADVSFDANFVVTALKVSLFKGTIDYQA